MFVRSSSERPNTKHSIGNTLQSAFLLRRSAHTQHGSLNSKLTRSLSPPLASSLVQGDHQHRAEKVRTPSPDDRCQVFRLALFRCCHTRAYSRCAVGLTVLIVDCELTRSYAEDVTGELVDMQPADQHVAETLTFGQSLQ